MRKRALCAGVAFCAVVGLAVQSWAYGDRLLDVGGTLVSPSENTEDRIDTSIRRDIGWAKGKLPIPLGGGNAIILGFGWEGQYVDYSDFKTTTIRGKPVTEHDLPDHLTALDANLGFLWKFTQNWSVLGSFQPGIHSDFEDISSEDRVYNWSVMFMRPFGKGNRFGLGGAYSDAFGEPKLIPLFLIEWYPSPKWFVEGTLPLELDGGYRFSKVFSLGLEAKLKGYMYRLTEDDPWNGDVLKYREVRIGPYLDYMFYDKAHVRFSAGAVVGQTFEIRNESNDKKLMDGDYKNAGYATLNLYYTM